MLRQIMADYPALPDFRTLSLKEIKFFYEDLIPGLLEAQKESE